MEGCQKGKKVLKYKLEGEVNIIKKYCTKTAIDGG